MFSVENAAVIPNIDQFLGSEGRRLQDLDASGQTNIPLVELQAFLQRFLEKKLTSSWNLTWRCRDFFDCTLYIHM